jgi:hypothetical protein
MKKLIKLSVVAAFALSLISAPACNRKTGCPVNSGIEGKTDKNGAFAKPKKKPYGLFPPGVK